jgi:hypothetical protein
MKSPICEATKSRVISLTTFPTSVVNLRVEPYLCAGQAAAIIAYAEVPHPMHHESTAVRSC